MKGQVTYLITLIGLPDLMCLAAVERSFQVVLFREVRRKPNLIFILGLRLFFLLVFETVCKPYRAQNMIKDSGTVIPNQEDSKTR